MPLPPPDGMLLVDKPAGPTSHDVVAAVRRSLGTRRVGHTGTLDPFATGLMVVLVGRAATVTNNQIKTLLRASRSVNFSGMPGPYIGNIAGPTHRATEFPAPENGFNTIM